MQIKLKNFTFQVTYPAISLISFVIISNFATGYLACLLAVVIHEFGHLFAMKICGVFPKGIKISAFDVKIFENSRHQTSFVKDIFITFAGAMFNIFAFIILFNINLVYAFVSLFIGLFNLLPAATLDGGQILYLIFTRRFSAEISARIVDAVTLITSIPLFFAGIMILLNSHYNFSLLFISLYLVLSLFLRKDKYL